jgi:hypothetical protein
MKLRRAAALLNVCVLLVVARADAQTFADTAGFSTPVPGWIGQFSTLSANAALGGLTAGIIQELRGGSFKDGFVRGVLGGTVVYVGKRVAAERFFGAGFSGREVAAVGASMVHNAADRIGTFDRLVLPAGLARVYWDRKHDDVQVRLDAVTTGYTVYGILEKELSFDAHDSFSAGAPVFRTHNKVIQGGVGEHAAGVQAQGVIFRADVPGFGEKFLQRAFAHERVHVLQDDQLFIMWNEPLNRWALSHTAITRTLDRYIDLDFSSEALRQLARFIDRKDRPWEIEAIYLTRK